MNKRLVSILLRYPVLIIIGFFIPILYTVFSPLTVYPSFFLLKIFYPALLEGNSIVFPNLIIKIIDACVAGSAYYLLLILNLSTPSINIKKRLSMLGVAFLSFLFINIFRIFFLSILAVSGNSFFDITHKIFWYAISTVFVVGIWFAEARIFRIKDIPFYSDMKLLAKKSYLKKD
ncbi:MAG: pacearchaeosortase [Nanoarchaeota archaeon]